MALGQKEISLKIKANTKKFQDELKKLPGVTDKEAKKMAGKFAKQFHKAEQAAEKSAKKMSASYSGSFGKMGAAAKNFNKLLVAGAFAGAAKGLFELADSASRYVDKIGVMSRQTGLNTDTLIAMEFASQAAGLSLDNLSAGLNTFTNKAGQAHNVGGAATRIFDRLGVSVEDADGNLRSMDDVFRETVNALAGMPSVAEQATTAIELFGARGSKIAAVFGTGTDNLDDWTKKVEEAGLIMDGDAKRASANMDHAMAELKLTLRAVSMETGENLIPAMIGTIKVLGTLINWLGKAARAYDTMWKFATGGLTESEEVEDSFIALQRVLLKVEAAAQTSGKKIADESGLMWEASRLAKSLRSEWKSLDDVNQKLAKGYKLTTAESKRIFDMNRRLSFAAHGLGLDYEQLTAEAKGVRKENKKLNEEVDLSALEAELAAVTAEAKRLAALEEKAKKLAEALDKLNRSFELEALARTSPALAKFEKEMDRINDAVDKGLSAENAFAARLAAQHDLWQAEQDIRDATLEKEQELQDKIADIQDKQREEKRKADEASAAATAAIQTEFLTGTQSVANGIFELAKAQNNITFEQAQGLAIAQAIMNTAIGVSKELSTKGVAGIATGAIVAAEGALQVAMIKSQTMHAGGMVGGTPDERPANLLTGEAVITRAGVESLGGAAGVNSINSGASMAPIVVINQYKHRSLDVQIRDQLRSDSALTRATSSGQRMGHK